MPDKTKNDIAWEYVFSDYRVIETVEQRGVFEITADRLKKYREPRLMASIDHAKNKPRVFIDNNLSILPNTRSTYIIGRFDTHAKVVNSNPKPIHKQFPANIKTIDPSDLYSESMAIHCAFNGGIINDLIGEETFSHTISGKMSSGEFEFSIKDITKNLKHSIKVKNAGCEIDAGFESSNKIILLEAKKMTVDDFVIRQLYYPYRLWMNKNISKEIVPIFMTISNDVFSFFIYKFSKCNDYNSLELVSQKDFTFTSQEIRGEDVRHVFDRATPGREDLDIPFPQADSFSRVIDLLGLLFEAPLSKDEITTYYDFDARQTNYYTDAARYLGLVDKYKDEKNKEIMFSLTTKARSIMSSDHKSKILELIEVIFKKRVFYETYKGLLLGKEITKDSIASIIQTHRTDLSKDTPNRRAQTVKQWLDWITSQITK